MISRVGSMLILMAVAHNGLAAESMESLFGIALGQSVDALQGSTKKLPGVVRINGVDHERHAITDSPNLLVPPISQVVVSVETGSRRITAISGFAEIEAERCTLEALRLKTDTEKQRKITFTAKRHQSDAFYVNESDTAFLSIGCRNKRKSLLQYQLISKGR